MNSRTQTTIRMMPTTPWPYPCRGPKLGRTPPPPRPPSRSKRKADKDEFRFGTAGSDGPEDSKRPKRSRQRLSAWRPICRTRKEKRAIGLDLGAAPTARRQAPVCLGNKETDARCN
jgi:hypothetical protein